MKKRILKISALTIALLLIIAVGWFANALVGNPLSKWMATNTAKAHLKENYGDRDFVLDSVTFNFKFGYYHAHVSSPSSMDSHFTLLIGMNGRLIEDTYQDRVVHRWNTADRIGREYRNAVDAVLNSPAFPYHEHIGFGDLAFVPMEYKEDPSVPYYAIITEHLTLDAFYNVCELGETAGKLTIYLEEETVSCERMAEILLDVKGIFDNAGVKFCVLDFVLEHPKSEEGPRPEDRLEIMDFPCADIYEEGLTERVRAANEAAQAYHAAQDGEKKE